MTIKLKIEKEYEAKTLVVSAAARYWEDASVNGVEDTEGDLIPCRIGDSWCPIIDIDTGQITNWEKGKEADIHYKVCDAGEYELLDENFAVITKIEGYVPSTMCPKKDGYGDYIKMDVDADGYIQNWKFNPEDFTEE